METSLENDSLVFDTSKFEMTLQFLEAKQVSNALDISGTWKKYNDKLINNLFF